MLGVTSLAERLASAAPHRPPLSHTVGGNVMAHEPTGGFERACLAHRWVMARARLPILLSLVLLSCASLGTRTDVWKPQAAAAIHTVGLAPVIVDSHTMSVCREAQRVARDALVAQLDRANLFEVIGTDSLLSGVETGSTLELSTVLEAARRLHLDAVLLCRLGAVEFTSVDKEVVAWGLSVSLPDWGISVEPTEYREVTTVNWTGAKVLLQIAECSSGELVAAAAFDTFKGKSYWSMPSVEKQVADAVEGAFRPIAKAWRR